MWFYMVSLPYIDVERTCGRVDMALDSKIKRYGGLIPTAGHVYKCQVDFSFHAASVRSDGCLVEWKKLNCNDWLQLQKMH